MGDPWSEVEKNKRIAQSYLNEHRVGKQTPQPEVIEEWEPSGLPSAVWTKNWGAQLYWQLFYIGFGVLFASIALTHLSKDIGVAILFTAVGLLATAIGFGAMLLPRRRAERFEDGTFIFSRGRRRLVVKPGELDSFAYVFGGRILGRPYPLSVDSRRGDCTVAVLSDMRGFLGELRQQNPKAVIIDPLDWDT
jgi:hypothetical protein